MVFCLGVQATTIDEIKDGNWSDLHGIEFGYHLLPHFKSYTYTDLDILGYEYKTDTSDSDSNSDIYLMYKITFIYFLLVVLDYKIIIHVQIKVSYYY